MDPINIGQLVARRISFPVVRIAFQHQFRAARFPLHRLPGPDHRTLNIVVKGFFFKDGIILDIGVRLGMELLQIVLWCKDAKAFKGQRPLVTMKSQPHRINNPAWTGEDKLDGDVINLFQRHGFTTDCPFNVG